MENPKEEQDKDLALIKSHALSLSEHFDSVQIFVTRRNDNGKGTVNARWGTGDWFARFGHVTWWLNNQKGYAESEGSSDFKNESKEEF